MLNYCSNVRRILIFSQGNSFMYAKIYRQAMLAIFLRKYNGFSLGEPMFTALAEETSHQRSEQSYHYYLNKDWAEQ